MASLNFEGSVTAGCTRCAGAVSTFEWRSHERPYGMFSETYVDCHYKDWRREFRLFRCAGCGRGGLGVIVLPSDQTYPYQYAQLERFTSDVRPAVPLPKQTPTDIQAEFREGEACLQNGCDRAAAAMFRSALEKTLSAAGYKITIAAQAYTPKSRPRGNANGDCEPAAICARSGAAPQAFILVPVVGAFLIDIANAIVISGFVLVMPALR
jgi:hypothetical protein